MMTTHGFEEPVKTEPGEKRPDTVERGFHKPVMLDEVVEFLVGESKGGGLLFDGTLGGGGHARALLEACADCGLVGVDRDPEALKEAGMILEPFYDRVRLVKGRLDRVLEEQIARDTLKGVLLDLGVSSWQLDSDARGFTFRPGVTLDMRMEGKGGGRSAVELLNHAPLEEITRIFRSYGEERRAGRLARQIVARREQEPIRTTDQLVAVIDRAFGRPSRAKDRARLFQALRIATNQELEALENALGLIRDRLRPGGTAVIIAYHSLEDRMVKRTFQEWSRSCVCPPDFPICNCRGEAFGSLVVRKGVTASDQELAMNPRARSARLRVWRKAA